MTETFAIVPGQVRVLWVGIILAVLMLGVFGLLGVTLRAAHTARFEVSNEGLRLRGDLYGRLVPARALRVSDARAVNLNEQRALQPTMRTGGTALPGYRAGWFKLRDGQRALLYVTDPTHVAYVPTTEGYAVLVSVASPEAFVASLRRHVGG